MKQYKFTIICTALFIIPSFIHLIINFYGYLFWDNPLNWEKMYGAVTAILVASIGVVSVGVAESVAQTKKRSK